MLKSFTVQNSFLPFLITLLALLAFFFNNTFIDTLVYQRNLIAKGEIWRLFTGHFFHTNSYHLLLNLTALWMLWGLHKHYYRINCYAMLFISSALVCSIGLYYYSTDLIRYVGLSGVLHGIFVWGAIIDIKHHDKTGYLLFLGVLLKIIYEQLYGASSEVANLIAANVAVDAHLWGAVGGLLFALAVPYVPSIDNAKMKNKEKA